MKKLIPIFTLFVFAGCSNTAQEASIVFAPQGTMTYQYKMKSDVLNFDGIFDAAFVMKDSHVNMNVVIKDLSGSTSEYEDLGYGDFVGNSYTRVYDTLGKTADLENVPVQVLNTDLCVVEFPKSSIKVGETWKSIKTAKPDMFFETILVNYECTDINNDSIIVQANMEFQPKSKGSSLMMVSRKYEGEYVVSRADGSVISAHLDIEWISLYSESSAKVVVRKL